MQVESSSSEDDYEDESDPLLKASEAGDLQKVKEHLGLLAESRDSDGYTPLHRACYNGHREVVDFLLFSGADASACTNDGWQPLHSAARWDQYECVDLLMNRGANVNGLTSGGQTPLHLAAAHNATKTIEVLLMNPHVDATIKNMAGDTAEQLAIRNGRNGQLFRMAHPAINKTS